MLITFAGRSALPPALSSPWSADRKSTRLNSSHVETSYAVFCLKKKSATRASGRRSTASWPCCWRRASMRRGGGCPSTCLGGRCRASRPRAVIEEAASLEAQEGLIDRQAVARTGEQLRHHTVVVSLHDVLHLHGLNHHERLAFFFNDTATTEIYTLSLHDALPI